MFTRYNNCCPGPSRECPRGWVDVAEILSEPTSKPNLDRFYLISASPTGIFTDHANQYTWFDASSSTWMFCDPVTGDKVSVDGSCGWLCWNSSSWTVGTSGNVGMTYSGLNLGDGAHGMILKQVAGGQFQFREIIGVGSNVQVDTVGDQVRIAVAIQSGGGETNTGANVGASGARVFKQKSGLILQFRKLLAADSSMTVVESGDQITFRANVPAPPAWSVVNYGTAGVGPYDSVNTNEFRFRNLLAVSEDANVFGITLDAPNRNIEFAFTPSLGLLSLWGDALRLYDAPIGQDQVMTWDTDSWIGRTITISSLGTGQGTVYGGNPSALNWRIKSLRQGTNVTITQDSNEITINATGGITGFNNMGSGSDGEGWYSSIISNVAQFKRIKAGANIFLTSETNDILVKSRDLTAGTGMTLTPAGEGTTFAVTNYNTLLADAAVADSSWIKSGPPWLIRKAKAGSGISITQNTNDITFAHALTGSNLGAGVEVFKQVNVADFEYYTLTPGPGIDVQLVGNEVVISQTSGGGGSGAGVSGTALVGGYANSTVATPLADRWGFTATTVKFPSTTLAVATITKNGANEEFTINKVGKWKIAAKATLDTNASQTQHQMWAEVDTTGGGAWVEIAGSRSYAYTTNEINDLQTIHTGEFSLNVTNLTTKVRFRIITSGGTVLPSLLAGGTAVTFEEAVGPVWEVLTDSTTARTLSASDNGKIIQFTNGAAVTVTLDEDLLLSFQCSIIQRGAGLVSIVAGGAATIQSVVGTTPDISAQHGRALIVALAGTGANDAIFNVSGDII